MKNYIVEKIHKNNVKKDKFWKEEGHFGRKEEGKRTVH
jgi:hypothetical protein